MEKLELILTLDCHLIHVDGGGIFKNHSFTPRSTWLRQEAPVDENEQHK